ncbi:hypothetical protein [Chromohalobacter nigrandesensis]|uniref:hypothetical protein n=1 Tax=Chromohalobacter nigrandesensis TaxID=119863 RepID=UPI001FF5FFBD|nr:hypothetical protein [Chromohalobacter nigrandesensis]MCK0744115.1 hypothetical protein [Chromohalobacter nigrandesensis]
MPQPQPRATAIAEIIDELRRMEKRRGHTTQLDERRLHRSLARLDDSAESQAARKAIWAQWNRDHESFDSAVTTLLKMENLSRPHSLYVNFALMSMHALNPVLSSRLNRAAFRTEQHNLEFLRHVLRNAWHAADLECCEEVIIQLGRLKADDYDKHNKPLQIAKDLLETHGITLAEFQQHIQRVFDQMRGFLTNRPDAYMGTGIATNIYDDGHREFVLEFQLGVDDETLDTIDEALLELLSDTNRVRPALNKCVGVLVRDHPSEITEAC